jgi:two-component system nitrate/nitrite response regulator NarL
MLKGAEPLWIVVACGMPRAPDVANVLVVEAQPIYRAALEQLCADLVGFQVVASCGTATDGLAELARTRPDIAVVDPDLPDSRATAFLRAACMSAGERTRVLVLAADEDSASVYNALAFGVAGYLTKAFTDGAALSDALTAVARGTTVVSPELMRLIASEIRLHAGHGGVRLTRREKDILGLVALGCSAPQIARQLSLSQSTVKTHLRSLYEKLGVSDRAAAVAQAMKRGLVEAV